MIRTVLAAILLAATLPARGQQKVDLYGDPLPAGADVRLGTSRFRHETKPSPYHWPNLRFSDNETVHVAYGSSIHSYKAEDGQLLQSLDLGMADIRRSSISPDGKLALTLDYFENPDTQKYEYRARFWDLETGKPYSRLDTSYGFAKAAFFPDGKSLVTANNTDPVQLWDVPSGEMLLSFQVDLKNAIQMLAISPREDQLIALCTSNEVYLWDWLAGQEPFLLAKEAHFRSVQFSPTQSQLAISAQGGQVVQIWDTVTLQLIREIEPQPDCRLLVTVLRFTPDGRSLIGSREHNLWSGETRINVWDVATGLVKQSLVLDSQYPRDMTVSPDGKYLATESSSLQIWGLETGQCLSAGTIGHVDRVNSIVFGPDSRTVVSAGADATVRVWDTETGRQLHKLSHRSGSTVYPAAVSPDGRRIASLGLDNTLRIWDAESGEELHQLRGHGRSSIANDLILAFTPDGRRLASFGNDMYRYLWNVETGEKLASHHVSPKKLPPGPNRGRFGGSGSRSTVTFNSIMPRQSGALVKHAALSADAQQLVFEITPAVYRFDVETGAEIASFTLEGAPQLWQLSHDGRLLLTSLNRSDQKSGNGNQPSTAEHYLSLCEVPSGQEVWKETIPNGGLDGPAAFSPDGRLMAVGLRSPHHEIRVWDLKTHEELLVIEGVPGITSGNTLAFSPDNRKLACAQSDHSILVWNLLDKGLPESMIAAPESKDDREE